jgi:hypothetical protein
MLRRFEKMRHHIRDFVRNVPRLAPRIGDKTTPRGYLVERHEILTLAQVYFSRGVGNFAARRLDAMP